MYTDKGGLGINEPGGFFFPDANVVLYANVTYNSEAVVDVLVSFEVKNPLNISIVYSTARTDMSGIAKINFTISSLWPPEETFGTYTTVATTSVAQRLVSDKLTFQVVEDPPLLGDINFDGKVDIRDATLLALAWNSRLSDLNYNPDCDFNKDGEVNIEDATVLGIQWGKTL